MIVPEGTAEMPDTFLTSIGDAMVHWLEQTELLLLHTIKATALKSTTDYYFILLSSA